LAIALCREDRHTQETTAEVRIDKWLWAARFFKTRSRAADAIAGGKVALNGARPKPSRMIRQGAHLNVHRGAHEWILSKERPLTEAPPQTPKYSMKRPKKAN
jgi:ribosomal 50S subunit-recycling heat shock protein